MGVRRALIFLGGCWMAMAAACDEGPRTGPGACVMHQEDPSRFLCLAVISLTHCEVEAANSNVQDPHDWTHFAGKTCEALGYRYCEFNGCIEGTKDGGCHEGGGTRMYANGLCESDIPPSEVDCTGGVFHGIWHSKNPSGTVKAHWDFDYCRVVSWDTSGEICGFHVEIQGFEFTGVGSDQGTVVVSYGDYYNWTLCEPDAKWDLDPTAPKGEQQPIPWKLVSDDIIDLNGERLYNKKEPAGKQPPSWKGPGNTPEPEPCGTLPEVSCQGS